MTTKGDTFCSGDDEWGQQLISYLYDDLEAGARARVEAHLSECRACRHELAALGGVRSTLAQWTPPEPSFGVMAHRAVSPPRSRLALLADIPVWARTAAALLCVGLAAGFANLNIQYGAGGLAVRTGWAAAPAPVANASPQMPERPWQADLVALERGLRAELASSRAITPSESTSGAGGAEMTGVRSLIEESEQRQRRELALRLADLLRDVEYRRRDDLEKIDRSLGLIQANLGVMQSTGVEVMRQRQMINDLAVRVSQR
jgi:hypothetical protein